MISKIVSSFDSTIVAEINYPNLHRYIVKAISVEFANMVENCYYPNVSKNSKLYRDLLHMNKSTEKGLSRYAKERYSGKYSTFKLLHDPYTMMIIIMVQEFIKKKDMSGAEAAFHLFALKFYTSLLYRITTPRGSHTKICNANYFQSALDNLSRNHIFVKQRTIANSVMYYSRAVMKRYLKALRDDDVYQIYKMIYEMRHRLMQSMRSFASKYYQARDEKDMLSTSKDEMDYDRSHERKLRGFVERISKDMCVYGKVDLSAASQATSLIKFNKKLSVDYAKTLSNPMFSDEINTALFLLVKDIKDVSIIKSTQFLDFVQKLLSIKVTNQTVYFKKTISNIHEKVIRQLNLDPWYSKLSIQSKSISRNYIAYYLAFYMRQYF